MPQFQNCWSIFHQKLKICFQFCQRKSKKEKEKEAQRSHNYTFVEGPEVATMSPLCVESQQLKTCSTAH